VEGDTQKSHPTWGSQCDEWIEDVGQINVGAIDIHDHRAHWQIHGEDFGSNFGPCVDLYAGGDSVRTAGKGDDTVSPFQGFTMRVGSRWHNFSKLSQNTVQASRRLKLPESSPTRYVCVRPRAVFSADFFKVHGGNKSPADMKEEILADAIAIVIDVGQIGLAQLPPALIQQ
jgi:hypothetical protein